MQFAHAERFDTGGGGHHVHSTVDDHDQHDVAPHHDAGPHHDDNGADRSRLGSRTGERGEPVARAFVTMGDERVITGPDGWFSFATASPGVMTVSKPGWTEVELAWDPDTTFYEAEIAPETIRGLRVSADAAHSDEAFAGLLSLADDTAVNALVFDTKQEGGVVLYDSAVVAAREIDAIRVYYDPAERIDQARRHDLIHDHPDRHVRGCPALRCLP